MWCSLTVNAQFAADREHYLSWCILNRDVGSRVNSTAIGTPSSFSSRTEVFDRGLRVFFADCGWHLRRTYCLACRQLFHSELIPSYPWIDRTRPRATVAHLRDLTEDSLLHTDAVSQMRAKSPIQTHQSKKPRKH